MQLLSYFLHLEKKYSRGILGLLISCLPFYLRIIIITSVCDTSRNNTIPSNTFHIFHIVAIK